jgi:hypothetical protein
MQIAVVVFVVIGIGIAAIQLGPSASIGRSGHARIAVGTASVSQVASLVEPGPGQRGVWVI